MPTSARTVYDDFPANDGAMHPKGTCSASLHCVGIGLGSPFGRGKGRPYTVQPPPYPVTKASGKPAAFTFSQYSSALRRKRKAPTCTRYSGVSSTGGSGVSAGSVSVAT